MAASSPLSGDYLKPGTAEEISGACLNSRLSSDDEYGGAYGGAGGRGRARNAGAMPVVKGKVGGHSLTGLNLDPRISVFNLANSAIGSGVLAFPYACRHLGAVGGVLFVLVIYVVMVLSVRVLVRAAWLFRCTSFQDVVVITLGPWMSFVANLMILVYLMGALVSYLIVTTDIFLPLFVKHLAPGHPLTNRSVLLCLISVIIILPLALKKTMESLKWSSVLSVSMLSYLAITLFCLFARELALAPSVRQAFEHVTLFKIDYDLFASLSIFVFAFNCNIQVVTIFAELGEEASPLWCSGVEEERMRGGGGGEGEKRWGEEEKWGRKIAIMDEIIYTGTGICLLLYSTVGFCGYVLYANVESDVLSSFEQGNLALDLVRYGMALVAIVAYPVNHFPARSMVADVVLQIASFKKLYKSSPSSSSSSSSSTFTSSASLLSMPLVTHVVLSVGLLAITLVVALCVSEIGTVMSLVGSSSGVLIIFIIPGLLLVAGIDTRWAPKPLKDASAQLPLLAEAEAAELGGGGHSHAVRDFAEDANDRSLSLTAPLARDLDRTQLRRPVASVSGKQGRTLEKLPTASWVTFTLGCFMLVFGAVIFVSTVAVKLSNIFSSQ